MIEYKQRRNILDCLADTKLKKKILIFGCGTIGGIIAARLSKVSDIVAFDTNSNLVKTINKDGLKIIEVNNNINRTKFCVYSKIEKLKNFDFDLVILATKAYDTKVAVKTISKYITLKRIISIQNGLSNLKTISEHLPRSSISCGITTLAAQMIKEGEIKIFHQGIFYLSKYKSAIKDVSKIANLFTKGGLNIEVARDYKKIIWCKLIFNSVMNPLPVILRSDYGIIKKSAETRTLIRKAINEGISVAHKLRIKLFFDPYEIVKKIQSGKLGNFKYKGSLYYDIVNGGNNEIEFITGEVIREAHRLKLKVPILETIYLMVKILEKSLNQV